jgi:1,4-dihydroxy-2-naphthoyl-CoA hydrolase
MTSTHTLQHPDWLLPDDLPADLDALMRAEGWGAGGLYWKLGIKILTASGREVTGTMPVAGNTQPHLLLHGGASIAFAETLASTAAALHAAPNRIAVGVEVSASHHRAARSGTVRGVATATHLGSALASYEVVVSDEDERRLSSVRVTCMLRPRPTAG